MAGPDRRDSFDGIAIFVRVAQSTSFTEAARQLGLSASGVSRAIARLESRLGTRLVDRTTRRLSLTAEGSAFFERCRYILAELEAAEDALAQSRSVPRGPLRIQVPRGFGRTVIVPALTGFLSRYPEVTVDMTVNDGAIDPGEEGVDASFILGEPATGRFVARRICTIGYAVCAAPAYLQAHGEPAELDDLARHRCLNYLRPRSGRRRDWTLRSRGKEVSVPVASVLNANDIQAVHQAALSGAGLAYLMDFLIASDVAAGRLKIVLPDYVLRGVPVFLCYPRSPHRSPRLTAFVDYLGETLAIDADWSIDRLLGSFID
ncbi:MAG: LysR family transcriptional regulator [Defluviicoccus sp.]|nr:LysR family transcriptional regulator [Defluviicoccus sp.]MDE0385223.1 LysR family transcriptional regulator [Defluviicoccus sp.]